MYFKKNRLKKVNKQTGFKRVACIQDRGFPGGSVSKESTCKAG